MITGGPFQSRNGERRYDVSNVKMTFIGGDVRMLYAAEKFARDGTRVFAYGFGEEENNFSEIVFANDLNTALESADEVILPVPWSRDGKTVNAPLCDKKIYIDDVLSVVPSSAVILGGMTENGFTCENTVYDYAVRRDFAIRNAIPTSEAAICIAIKESRLTICGMNTCVIGFGSVGKALARTLVSLGADVTVFARSAEARAEALAFFCKAYDFSCFDRSAGNFDCVFNTVPHVLLGEKELSFLDKNVIAIELASSPGGFDKEAAEKYGIHIISAPSLPGRVTPKTAGKIIYDILSDIKQEKEI